MQIRAAVCRGFGDAFGIETLDLRPPEGREVEVAIGAVAICHSDVLMADGAWGGALPAVYGHEAAGRVAAVGPEVRDVHPGDKVLVTLVRACGACPACADGHPVACGSAARPPSPLTDAGGAAVAQGMDTAAFAERVVVDESQIAAIPEDIPMEAASLLSCGVITGVGAVVNDGALRAGEDVVVVGAGGVGLNAVQGARIAGARRIVAVDLTEEKLAAARVFGATDGVLAAADPVAEARAILGRGADAVFVTVGAPGAYGGATGYLAPRGRLVAVGMTPGGTEAPYAPDLLAYSGHRIVGSRMGDVVLSRDIPWLADLYLQGRLKLDELISGRWRLDEINAAMADTRAGAARRNVILFDEDRAA
ncbi:MAG: zinc-binding dehydrogenase [Paracoccaceae bacterium]|nr:zinc-binding dehydrogenase [Paracoccaceae bacterium]